MDLCISNPCCSRVNCIFHFLISFFGYQRHWCFHWGRWCPIIMPGQAGWWMERTWARQDWPFIWSVAVTHKSHPRWYCEGRSPSSPGNITSFLHRAAMRNGVNVNDKEVSLRSNPENSVKKEKKMEHRHSSSRLRFLVKKKKRERERDQMYLWDPLPFPLPLAFLDLSHLVLWNSESTPGSRWPHLSSPFFDEMSRLVQAKLRLEEILRVSRLPGG